MPKRVDELQPEIVRALRDRGVSVGVLSPLGHGCPDLIAGWQGRNVLIEVKQPKGRLTPDEATWHALWRGEVVVVRSVAEALAAVGWQEV